MTIATIPNPDPTGAKTNVWREIYNAPACTGALTADTWEIQTDGDFTALNDSLLAVASDQAGTWVAVSNYNYIGTSTDGGDWVQRYHNISLDKIAAVVYMANKWVAVGTDYAYVSTDSINWVRYLIGPYTFHGVYYNDGKWVAVGTTGKIYTSSDAKNWVEATSFPASAALIGAVIYANNLWVAGRSDGYTLTSTDGETWTEHATTFDAIHISSIAYGQSKFIAVNFNGQIGSSTDGITWVIDSIDHGILNAVRFSPVGLWIAGGQTSEKEIYYSTDGLDWTLISGALGGNNGVDGLAFD